MTWQSYQLRLKSHRLRQALEEDLINFDKNLKEQKQYTDLFNFLLSRSK